MDRIYWLMIKNEKGKIADVMEASWGYFFTADNNFRSHIKKTIIKCVNDNGSYEFALKSNFENRGLVNKHK